MKKYTFYVLLICKMLLKCASKLVGTGCGSGTAMDAAKALDSLLNRHANNKCRNSLGIT